MISYLSEFLSKFKISNNVLLDTHYQLCTSLLIFISCFFFYLFASLVMCYYLNVYCCPFFYDFPSVLCCFLFHLLWLTYVTFVLFLLLGTRLKLNAYLFFTELYVCLYANFFVLYVSHLYRNQIYLCIYIATKSGISSKIVFLFKSSGQFRNKILTAWKEIYSICIEFYIKIYIFVVKFWIFHGK